MHVFSILAVAVSAFPVAPAPALMRTSSAGARTNSIYAPFGTAAPEVAPVAMNEAPAVGAVVAPVVANAAAPAAAAAPIVAPAAIAPVVANTAAPAAAVVAPAAAPVAPSAPVVAKPAVQVMPKPAVQNAAPPFVAEVAGAVMSESVAANAEVAAAPLAAAPVAAGPVAREAAATIIPAADQSAVAAPASKSMTRRVLEAGAIVTAASIPGAWIFLDKNSKANEMREMTEIEVAAIRKQQQDSAAQAAAAEPVVDTEMPLLP